MARRSGRNPPASSTTATPSARRARRPVPPLVAWLRAGAAVAAFTPAPVDRAIAGVVGLGAARLPGVAERLSAIGLHLGPGPALMAERRRTVARNLTRIVGPGLTGRRLERSVDASFGAYARYWTESLRLPSLSAAEIAAAMSRQGFGPLYDAVDAGRGVILALPHLGGWEWGGAWLAQEGIPVSVVVEDLVAHDVFEWFSQLRLGMGLDIIVNGPSAGADCVAALRRGRVLCLLSDRVVGRGGGISVELFGGGVVLPAGPAVLGLRTGAPVLPAAVYFTAGNGHLAVVRPPLCLRRGGDGLRADVAAATQELAREMEALIRRDPTQWYMWTDPWAAATDPGRS